MIQLKVAPIAGSHIVQSQFPRRLVQACDESPDVPAHGKGRQVYIAKRLKVTQEAVRKWLVGEALPRPDKIQELAKVLGVDPIWLQLGAAPMDIAEKRQAALRGDAAVYGVMSYLLLAGYHVAVPATPDARVDVYAIKHGTQLSVTARMGAPISKTEYRFVFPANLDARWNAVILSDQPSLSLEIYDVPPELALRYGTRTGEGVDFVLKRTKTKMMIGGVELRQLRCPSEEQ